MALFLSLAIEIPVSNIQKMLFRRDRKPETNNNNNQEKSMNGNIIKDTVLELNNAKNAQTTQWLQHNISSKEIKKQMYWFCSISSV